MHFCNIYHNLKTDSYIYWKIYNYWSTTLHGYVRKITCTLLNENNHWMICNNNGKLHGICHFVTQPIMLGLWKIVTEYFYILASIKITHTNIPVNFTFNWSEIKLRIPVKMILLIWNLIFLIVLEIKYKMLFDKNANIFTIL